MNGFVLVLLIAAVAAVLTYLGAPAAGRFDILHRVVSGALQFAAGVNGMGGAQPDATRAAQRCDRMDRAGVLC